MVDHRSRHYLNTAFKKCMKGRLGCGGSSFPRVRIVCGDPNNCGGCGLGFGCNIGGSLLHYCDPRNVVCRCANTVFHEMAHSCGSLHSAATLQQNACVAGDPTCVIGDWFDNECMSPGGRMSPAPPTGTRAGDE